MTYPNGRNDRAGKPVVLHRPTTINAQHEAEADGHLFDWKEAA